MKSLIALYLSWIIAYACLVPSMSFSPNLNHVHTSSAIFMSEEDVTPQDFAPPQPTVRCPNCDKCDGSGRILGGIPTILPWWPIKPYRPCPNFIANGGQYTRIGQPLDEIAFGRSGNVEDDDDF